MADSPHTPGPAPTLEIAHVLFMDIVGYSKLPMDAQELQLRRLQEVVRGTVEFTRAQTADQLIRLPTGDGMALVFFGDSESPARCALEVHRALQAHPQIGLRTGIHSGPVYRVADINANRNVAGGGINMAQRVMDSGDAGHILLSGAEADVLGHVSYWKHMLHDLGEVEVKHGVRLRLYNLYGEGAGNPELPQKLRTAQAVAQAAATAAEQGARSRAQRTRISFGSLAAGIAVVLAVGAWLYYARHAQEPHIEITKVPFADPIGGPGTSAPIAGRVTGVDNPNEYRVVLFALTIHQWWVQPLKDAPYTRLQNGGEWSTWTHTGERYAALLVRKSYVPPAVTAALPQLGQGVIDLVEVAGRRPEQ